MSANKRIVKKDISNSLIMFNEHGFNPGLGREDALKQIDKESLKQIINPITDFETVRFTHQKYAHGSGQRQYQKEDIYLCFYFFDESINNWVNDYSPTGLDKHENARITKEISKSFFKLDFYDTPYAESQKLLFSKIFPIPFGNRVFSEQLNDSIFIPSFTGNRIKNTENFHLFWFLDNDQFTGDTFYVTAKFYNAENGRVIPFLNKEKEGISSNFNPNIDRYYQLRLDRENFTYAFYSYDGVQGDRIGTSPENCVFFSQIAYIDSVGITPTPTNSPTVTPSFTPTITISPTPSQTIYLTPTPSISITPTKTPTRTPTPTRTVTPTISVTPTNTRTPTLTKTVTGSPDVSKTPTPQPSYSPTISVTPTITPSHTTIIGEDCPSSHVVNAYVSANSYYVNVGSTSGPVYVDIKYLTDDDAISCVVFFYGNTEINKTCVGGGGYKTGDAHHVTLNYIYNPAIGTQIRVLHTSNAAICECLPTQTPTPSVTSTVTPTITPTISVTATVSPTVTPTISVTPTNTHTRTPTRTPIEPTPSPTISVTPTVTDTPTSTPTNTPTISVTPTITITPTITETVTPTITETVTPTASVTPTISETPLPETPTNTPTISVTPTITETPTNTPTISVTPTSTVTPTVSTSPTSFTPERILVDVGGDSRVGIGQGTTNPDSNGRYWNTWIGDEDGPTYSGFISGCGINNLINTVNTGTTVGIVYPRAVNISTGGTGINNIGFGGVVGDYPGTATSDSVLCDVGAEGQFIFTGLTSSRTYSFTFWGNRNASGPRIIQFKASTDSWVGGTVLEYDAALNTTQSQNATFSSITGVSTITFDFRVKSGSTFGYVGVIDINVT